MKDKVRTAIFLWTLFLISSLWGNFFFSFIVFSSVFFYLLKIEKKTLRLAGGGRFWILPVVFICLTPFLGEGGFSAEAAMKAFFIWLNLYTFNCLVNFLSYSFSLRGFIGFFEDAGMRGAGFKLALALCAFSKIRLDTAEIFYFYRLENRKVLPALTGLPSLIYIMIRNSAKTAENISELLFTRNVQI